MHPLLARRGRLTLYLAIWLLPASLVVFLLANVGQILWMEAVGLSIPACTFYAFVCLTPWYLCRSLPLRETEPVRLMTQHGFAAVIAAAIFVGVTYGFSAVASQLAPALNGVPLSVRVRQLTPLLFGLGVLLYALAVAAHYAWIALEDSREAALLARDAELRALKAQINPHFLFNSLNSISALTTVDPVRARDMCLKLSEFLRSTLGLGEKQTILWRDELSLARTYLDVEQVRFGKRLNVEFDVGDECSLCRVPPLVLQPLVENAIKHGIASLVEGGVIHVEARTGNGLLRIVVENPYDPESPAPRRSGLGLRNVRDRLEARYGGAANVTVRAEGDRFRVELLIPAHEAE